MNKIFKWHPFLNGLFPLSIGALIFSLYKLISLIRFYPIFSSNPLFYAFVWIGAIEQVYALFFALPLSDTYTKLSDIKLIDSGIYRCCRHPGVWGFILMAVGFTLGSGSMLILWTALTWTLFDLIHVWIQDVYIFPRSIPGYDQYQRRVPFLFINVREYF